MNFIEKLTGATRKNNSLLCIGLDPDPGLMPGGVDFFQLNRDIIDATGDLVCAYKLNFAFYEALGGAGCDILQYTVGHIPDEIPVIGDAKRGDIGNTAKAYAKAAFNTFNCDAVTVNPYLGYDSIEPFLEYKDKGVFLLCRTSNPGSADFQSLECQTEGGRVPLYQIVADSASRWNKYGNIGLVVGATQPQELKLIRQRHPDLPLLIPGIGAQGGDLEQAVKYGTDTAGEKAIISSSRQIMYASPGPDYAQAARQAAVELRDRINRFRHG